MRESIITSMSEPLFSPQTLLLVDDDTTFSSVLGRALERRGYEVISATTIAEALSLSQQFQPQQAVVDLKLEQESGLQLIPKLKACLPKVNILILTGYSSISTAVEAIKLGATNYLCKPAGTDEILTALNEELPNPKTPVAEAPPSINRLEWEHIQKVLAENDGNISATARSLGMHRRTLQRKLQKRPHKY